MLCCDIHTRQRTKRLLKAGKYVEVMVYGDGAFKDPVGRIWELADPVVLIQGYFDNYTTE